MPSCQFPPWRYQRIQYGRALEGNEGSVDKATAWFMELPAFSYISRSMGVLKRLRPMYA